MHLTLLDGSIEFTTSTFTTRVASFKRFVKLLSTQVSTRSTQLGETEWPVTRMGVMETETGWPVTRMGVMETETEWPVTRMGVMETETEAEAVKVDFAAE